MTASTMAEHSSAAVADGRGRRAFGVSGSVEYGPLKEALAASRATLRAALLLGAAGAGANLAVLVQPLLGRRIAATLGIGSLDVLAITIVVFVVVGALAVSRIGLRHDLRRIAALGCVASAAGLFTSALAGSFWGLFLGAALGGLGAAAAGLSHGPMVCRAYRPEVRCRAISAYWCANAVATGVGVLVFALGRAEVALAWRGSLAVAAGLLALLVPFLVTVPPLEADRWDAGRLDREVFAEVGGREGPSDGSGADERLSFVERARRVALLDSARALLTATALAGAVVGVLPSYVPLRWRDAHLLTDATSGFLLGGIILVGAAGPLWLARRSEVALRVGPAHLGRLLAFAASAAAVGLAFVPASPGLLVETLLLGWVVAVLVATAAGAQMLLLLVADPRYRHEAGLLLVLAFLGGASLTGRFLVAPLATRFSVEWGLLALAATFLVGAKALLGASSSLEADLDANVAGVVERAELRAHVSQGRHVPLLACRGVDFSYGSLQVLFGVDFTVDEGEMVALLGTNGAGKSTLLRAISGVGATRRGTIRYQGVDITHAPYDRRVDLGISQIPGGRAVFGTMTVVDNLRAYAYTQGANRGAVESGLDAAFDAFPRLAERRSQLASTLSGGEQQMLGLSKALILRPRLLLIDELSLGLAPKIVGELLAMVRQINASGTAVVLVEQSVNVALSLVQHAYFMEKGEIRFDGRASDLLDRPDLLRAVFLHGAGGAVETTSVPSRASRNGARLARR